MNNASPAPSSIAKATAAKTKVESAAPSQVPASVPHFKSFAEIADPRVRRAKEYEQYLLFSRERFPEFGARIDRELDWARSEQERSAPSDRERVHSVLEQNRGGLLCEEVAEDSGLPYSTAYKHLRAMLDKGIVAATSRPGISANKPMIVWTLAH
jgi:DNA-binding transcriptional ArsR family regulator